MQSKRRIDTLDLFVDRASVSYLVSISGLFFCLGHQLWGIRCNHLICAFRQCPSLLCAFLTLESFSGD